MRRVPSILLVFLLGFSSIGPAFFTDAESNLPACCRRDGKHHCGMMTPATADTQSPGAALDTSHTRCPLFPAGGALLPDSGAAALHTSGPNGISITVAIAVLANRETGYRILFNRADPQRGPPALL